MEVIWLISRKFVLDYIFFHMLILISHKYLERCSYMLNSIQGLYMLIIIKLFTYKKCLKLLFRCLFFIGGGGTIKMFLILKSQ